MKRRAFFGLMGGAAVAKVLGLDVSAAAMETASDPTLMTAMDIGSADHSAVWVFQNRVFFVGTGEQIMEWTGTDFETWATTD